MSSEAAASLVAGAVLAQLVVGVSYVTGVWISAAVVCFYTCTGGYRSLVSIGFFQGMLMLLTLLVLAGVSLDGLSSVDLNLIRPASFGGWKEWVSEFAWGLGYFGQLHIAIRFLGMSHSEKEIPKAAVTCLLWMLLALSAAIAVGFGGALLSEVKNSEGIFLELAEAFVPEWFVGVAASGILAAIMSTAAVQFFLAGTSGVNVFSRFVKRAEASSAMYQIGIVVAAVCSVFLALNPSFGIFKLVALAWSGLGASFGPPILISLYWRSMTAKAALGGMLVGALTVLVLESLPHSFI